MQGDALQSPGFFSDINGLHLSHLWPDQLIRTGTVAGSLGEMDQRAASLGACRDSKIKVKLDHSGGCLIRFYFNIDIFYLALKQLHKLLTSWPAWSFWFCPPHGPIFHLCGDWWCNGHRGLLGAAPKLIVWWLTHFYGKLSCFCQEWIQNLSVL